MPTEPRNETGGFGRRMVSPNFPRAGLARRYDGALSGRGAAWLAHWSGGPGVAGSNPAVPTMAPSTMQRAGGGAGLSNDDAAVAGMAEVVSRRGKARPSARATIPNALSAARLAAVPIFVWLFGRHEERAAVLVFGGAALTDAFDGLLARRTGTESELGKLLDPLADRVFISAVVVALVARGTLARPLAAAIVGRDLLILLLWPLMERRGIERIRVNAVGKSATALLLTGLTWLALSETSLAVSASRRLAATVVIAGGAVLYWGAGLMYATEARRRLRGLA